MEIIKEISAAATYKVRHPVLRERKPIESCAFEDDENDTTKHYGFFINEELIGVASLFFRKNSYFTVKNQFQLRGMAVLPKYQNIGIGKKLVEKIEFDIQKNHQVALIWFNAREIAVGFYEKFGYERIGNSFEIENIGRHFVMYKEL